MSNHENLLRAAVVARAHAYAPYSKFDVGAALITEEGKIYTGCNVENASYGLTICAERGAICAAVANGDRSFSALVVTSAKGVRPCGACLQVLAEFCEDLDIFLLDSETPDNITQVKLSELLPQRFRRG